MNWPLIEIVKENNEKTSVVINWPVIAGIVLGLLIIVVAYKFIVRLLRTHYKDIEVESITIGSANCVTLRCNKKQAETAYKVWVELSTRKICLPFDEDNDVLVQVYDSWYDAFQIIRDAMKQLPPPKEKNDQLVGHCLRVLNDCLRPHLTKYQARFRKWYDFQNQLESNKTKDPQDIQKAYPNYKELIDDLNAVCVRLQTFQANLLKIAASFKGEKEPKKKREKQA